MLSLQIFTSRNNSFPLKYYKTILIGFMACMLQPALYGQHFIREGIWRGSFKLPSNIEAPFDFEITGTSVSTARANLINGTERVEIRRFKKTSDSIYMYLDAYENELAFKIVKPDSMVGMLRQQDGKGRPIPLTATNAENFRFPLDGPKHTVDLNGKWLLEFENEEIIGHKAIGILVQKGDMLHGTIVTATGDFRYLDGIVKGSNFYLSTFNGSEPVYLQGKTDGSKALVGTFYNGEHTKAFTGRYDAGAALDDPYKLTRMKAEHTRLSFKLFNINNEEITLSNKKYSNKVVIISLTSSDQPNCNDETAFLAPWYRKNKHRGVEMISVYFEKNTNSIHVGRMFAKTKQRFGIEYEQVLGGKFDTEEVLKVFPELENFISFPTLLVIDKNAEVVQVHTGFYSAAAGVYHQKFLKEFETTIDKLVKEPAPKLATTGIPGKK